MSGIPECDKKDETAPPTQAFASSSLSRPWQVERPALHSPEQNLPDSLAHAPASDDTRQNQILFMQELEGERQRIAMDLHDGLGPLITLIKLELHNAKILMCLEWSELEPARAAIERAEENVARTFEELRRAVLDLRPAILDDLGIVLALGWLIRQFELSGTDVHIHSKIMADDRHVPAALKIVIFRICQESLNNIIKHAHASNVDIELEITGAELELSIEDDGGGMAVAASDILHRTSGGLAGIARRVHNSHGKLTIGSAAGHGTRITICWLLATPVSASASDIPVSTIP